MTHRPPIPGRPDLDVPRLPADAIEEAWQRLGQQMLHTFATTPLVRDSARRNANRHPVEAFYRQAPLPSPAMSRQ